MIDPNGVKEAAMRTVTDALDHATGITLEVEPAKFVSESESYTQKITLIVHTIRKADIEEKKDGV